MKNPLLGLNDTKKVKLRGTEFDQLYEIESYQYMYIKCPADTFLINVWGGFNFHPWPMHLWPELKAFEQHCHVVLFVMHSNTYFVVITFLSVVETLMLQCTSCTHVSTIQKKATEQYLLSIMPGTEA